jgi:hypothetical protein
VLEEFTKPWIKHSDLLCILDGQAYTVKVLHSQRPAKWERVFLTMNRAVGDYELYPKEWRNHPDAKKAFWRRVKNTVYFGELRKCEHIKKPQEHGVQPDEISIAAFEAKKEGGLDDKHGQGEEMPVLSDTA